MRRIYEAYHEALRAELAVTGIDSDDAFVHLVFSALEGLVFQQVVLGDQEKTRGALARLRQLLALLRHAPPSS